MIISAFRAVFKKRLPNFTAAEAAGSDAVWVLAFIVFLLFTD